jgi:hypothetical protein
MQRVHPFHAASPPFITGRTTVSSAPAFLAEHLRGRLWKKEKRQLEDEGRELPAGSTQKVDAAECPDCFGTGMWYPEGFDKGVARCRHEKLTPDESKQNESLVRRTIARGPLCARIVKIKIPSPVS